MLEDIQSTIIVHKLLLDLEEHCVDCRMSAFVIQSENRMQKKRISELEQEIKKLSGQQNLQQRIKHHIKIKVNFCIQYKAQHQLSMHIYHIDFTSIGITSFPSHCHIVSFFTHVLWSNSKIELFTGWEQLTENSKWWPYCQASASWASLRPCKWWASKVPSRRWKSTCFKLWRGTATSQKASGIYRCHLLYCLQIDYFIYFVLEKCTPSLHQNSYIP